MRLIKTYSSLIKLETFEERFEYLRLFGRVGETTFNSQRYLNQRFYKSKEWADIKRAVIIRDDCCDLGVEGYDVSFGVLIHHMVPLTPEDLKEMTKYVWDLEYLITTSEDTHNALHYGISNYDPGKVIVRKAFDTCPWKEKIK